MSSISIGWKKQTANEVSVLSQKEHPDNRSVRKVAPIKQKGNSKKIETIQKEPSIWKKRLSEGRSYITLSANSTMTDVQSYHDRRLCSVRAGITTFIIIVTLILITAIALGIVFGVLKSQNSSGTGSDNQNSVTIASTGSLTSSISIGSQSGSACSTYTEINDPTRAYTYISSVSNCDNGPIFNATSGGAWIRFVGAGGNVLTQSPPGTSHCGAFIPIWYNASLPTSPNTITSGTVCGETYASTCGIVIDISVILCSSGSSYYVFLLPPLPICSARYCTA
ncbi:hypothetical protein I4U23_002538 [Adineta vaga]|nr:hypothetical protein I4U23_002538 [Adineta vaga]